MALKKGTIIPTIDVVLVTIITDEAVPQEYAIDTASKIGVEPQIETEDAKKLIVKGVLFAQKKKRSVLTGHRITLTDNAFIPEVVAILQGGSVQTQGVAPDVTVTGYTPPVAGQEVAPKVFSLCAYSAHYDISGQIIDYEKITYPNCTGDPIALNSEDGVFRVPEYGIDSAPEKGQAPYTIEYVTELPAVA